ncbi:MAG TPA: hypothetical protein VF342_01675 [Alphaproteobacteria bacterium]
MLTLDAAAGALCDAEGRRFDPGARVWRPHGRAAEGEAVSLRTAVRWLQRDSGHPVTAPIGVIGPREASPAQCAAAEEIGAALAEMGIAVLCGGRQGVMEAVCRGAASRGGLAIGLLPEADTSGANPHVTIALATGIGEARNALIARAAFCLVAVGNSYGTLSEVALGLQFGKRVFGLEGAATVDGVRHVESPQAAADAVARFLLNLDD